MLNPPQIRNRLGGSAAAAWRGDRLVLDETASWLTSVTARELLRIDHDARRFRYEGPALGEPEKWTSEVLASPVPVVAVLASMHPNGYVRERAVRSLVTSPDAVSDRALAVRVSDHVRVIREVAVREVLRRRTLDNAERVVPVLHRIEQRGRGFEVLALYLRALITEHGEANVWARLRSSADHDLRRAAFRHSFDSGLLGLPDAVVLLPGERDQVVRRRLIEIIADSAAPDIIAKVLLRDRSAESRTLALVKLSAAQLDPADVERLLLDSSVLTRLWARRRWQEMGRDPAVVYATSARSTATPIVRARAHIGLAETGTAIERREVVALVRSTELPLRKVGLSLLRSRATEEDIPLLLRSVAGDHSRVARLAGEVLIDNPRLWTVAELAPFKAAEDPELRRRAWWIHRRRGGWEAVIADLELLHDSDPRLAGSGRQRDLPMYSRPTATQQRRITELLSTAPIERRQRHFIAFAAGLPDLAGESEKDHAQSG
ncbi:hypothetical protein [Lentzea jiangxiensis]|uniref:HEAT repeat-containing protein n=1 Tax=Lentzea jiangxiensis TaxID=641025 RepID=A0A1H0K1S5_9PSEU|nr:hypothetical protein [Lentzea jiangxiensis]SDO49917.1 hypothetical protein SAMN05421507_102723 [Lentzea jiangxiensis]